MKLNMHRSLQGLSAVLLSLGLLLMAFVGTASAHAKVTQSDPAIGSTIATAPGAITVTALENINPDPKKSNLFVFAPGGDLISQGNATVSLNNPQVMSVNIKPSGDGIYVVQWITVSALDGDPDQGAFVFTVKAGGAATTTTNTPAKPTTTTTTSPSNTSSPLVPTIVTGIITLLVGLGAGFAIGRNRPTPANSIVQEPATEDVPSSSKR